MQRLECFVIFIWLYVCTTWVYDLLVVKYINLSYMYSKGCSAASVIAATIRHQMFTTGCKLHSILPSHTVPAWKASAITGTVSTGNMLLNPAFGVPNFSRQGWHKDGTSACQPPWLTLSNSSVACAIHSHRACIGACTGRYKCNHASAWCTTLWHCEAWCFSYGCDNQKHLLLKPGIASKTVYIK